MTSSSNHHVDPEAAERARQEAANRAAEQRYAVVLQSPEYQGRENLARELLAFTGARRLTGEEIVAALSKAPRASAEPAAPASSFNVPPGSTMNDPVFAFLTPSQVQWEKDYAAGAAMGKLLLRKK